MEKTDDKASAIPREFWNSLYAWNGGGYSGCFWEPNNGVVDADGHWRPIVSTGYNGIDVRILGIDVDSSSDNVVDQQVQDRLDRLFVDVAKSNVRRDDFKKVGSLDGAHIMDTCSDLADKYGFNAGLLVHTLDGLVRLGYSPWCKCTDCGEMFQLSDSDFETFSASLDTNSYVGNGGLGIIYTRVVCNECFSNCFCESCGELGRGRPQDTDYGSSNVFWNAMMYDWRHICESCAEDVLRKFKRDGTYEKYEELEESLSRLLGSDRLTADSYDKAMASEQGKKIVSEMQSVIEEAEDAMNESL